MGTENWQTSRTSLDWHGQIRGVRIRILVDPTTGKPTTLNFYVGGILSDSVPVTCDLPRAKCIAEKVVNSQILSDARYAQASERYMRGLFLRR
jgi:hypothetical protein